MALWTLAVALVVLAQADPDEAKARAEVELQLKRLTRAPPPSLEIRFDGIDSGRYELLEVKFALDGAALKTQPALGRGEKKATLLFFDMVPPGEHIVTANLVYREVMPDGVFAYSALKFTLPGRYTVTVENGLVLVFRAQVEVNDGAQDPKNRLELVASAEPMMVAKFADDTQASDPDAPVKIHAGKWRSSGTISGAPMSPHKSSSGAAKQ